jgi:hypothetical protein
VRFQSCVNDSRTDGQSQLLAGCLLKNRKKL